MIPDNSSKTIILRIDESSDARAFENSEEIVQIDAMEQLFTHIKDSLGKVDGHISKLKKSEFKDRLDRYHDTIALFGSRGTGKTTFILNTLEQIRSNGDYINNHQIKNSDVQLLDIKDPTLVEAKEHVFVNIISSIKEAVQSQCNFDGCRLKKIHDPCSDSNSELCDEGRRYEAWLSSLKRLAGGLPAIDGIGGETLNRDAWHDPIHVMEEGLKTVKASNNLERNFHLYVKNSLALIGKKAFVMAFDDVDTNFPAGWPVLETIRKYLTTPQLIIILSGDPKLYSKLIRQNQWQNFNKRFLLNENSRHLGAGHKTNFHQIIGQLEDQYLLKILKPQRRLRLKSVLEYVQSKKKKVDVLIAYKGENGQNIDSILKSSLKDIWGIPEETTAIQTRFREFILAEPIRTLVQLFAVFMPEESKRPYEKLSETYFSTLYRHGIETELQIWQHSHILPQIAKILWNNNLFSQGYKLLPDFEENPPNRLMLVLSAFVYDKIKEYPELFFDYMAVLCFPTQISETSSKKQTKSEDALQDYKIRIENFRNADVVTRSGYHTGYIRAIKNTILPGYKGTVALLRKVENLSSKKRIEENLSRVYGVSEPSQIQVPNKLEKISIDANPPLWEGFYTALNKETSQSKDDDYTIFFVHGEDLKSPLITSWHKIFAGLPAQYLVDRTNRKSVVWSIYNLLAAISKTMSCFDAAEIKETLIKHSRISEYEGPTLESEDDIDQVTEDQEIDINTEDEDFDFFSKEILEWKKSRPKNSSLPPYVTAKVFDRFFRNLDQLDKVQPANKTVAVHLGWLLNRYIIIFLDAVLVEEALYLEPKSKIKLEAPTTSDDVFYNKLKKRNLLSEKQPLSFFSWLQRCPLWYPYIDPEGELFKRHPASEKFKVKFQANTGPEPETFDNLYPILNVVLLLSKPVQSDRSASPKRWNIHTEFKNIVNEVGEINLIKQLRQRINPVDYFEENYIYARGYKYSEKLNRPALKNAIGNLLK